MTNRPEADVEREQRRRRVGESVWDWSAPQARPEAHATRVPVTALRDFAIGLVLAGVLYAAGRPALSGVAAVLSFLVLTVRAILPAALAAPIVAAVSRVAHHVGHAVTVVVLGLVYFTVFLLLRAWRTVTGHDTLRLKPRRRGESFWIDRSTLPETSPDQPY